MKVVILRKSVQTGIHKAVKGQTIEVPDAVATEWIAAKAARVATEAEVKATK